MARIKATDLYLSLYKVRMVLTAALLPVSGSVNSDITEAATCNFTIDQSGTSSMINHELLSLGFSLSVLKVTSRGSLKFKKPLWKTRMLWEACFLTFKSCFTNPSPPKFVF